MPDNNINPNILEVLGLMGPMQSETGVTQPEILEILRNYGAGGMNAKDPNRFTQPVSSGNIQATHWTQAVAQILDAASRQRALGQHNRMLIANRGQATQPPPGPNAPNPPPMGPGPRQPPAGVTPPPTVNNNMFGYSNQTPPSGLHTDNPGDLFGNPLDNFRYNVNPNQAPDVGGADQIADVNGSGFSGLGGALGQVGRTMQGQTQTQLEPARNPEGLIERLPPNDLAPGINRLNKGDREQPTLNEQRVPSGDDIITGSNPDRQPPSPDVPGITVEDTGRREINGMPVFRRQDYDLLATFPRSQTYRSGMPQDQQQAILNLPQDQRKAIEDAFAQQVTPQFTDVLGGRRWVIPGTGETGYIPTPLVSTIKTPGGAEVQTITLFDRNGRRQTFVLEPGTQPPPNSQVLTPGQQSPEQNLPGNRRILGEFGERAENELVNQNARVETAKQYAQGQAQIVQEAVNRSGPANQVLQITDHIQNLLNTPGANQRLTGRLAEPWMQAVRDVNAMFVAAGRQAPLNPNQVTIGELLDKLGILLAAPASHQLTNRPTQFDFQSFIRTNPNLTTSPDGARMMISIIRGFAERDRAISEYAGRWQQEQGPLGNSRGFIEGLHRVYDQHMSNIAREWLRNGLPVPRGFRVDGMEYIGGPRDNPNDRRFWQPYRGSQPG